MGDNQGVSASADEYLRRLDARRVSHEELLRRDLRYSNGRLGVFGFFALLLALGWVGLASFWLLVVPVIAFGVLMQRHDHIIRAREGAARAMAFYERGLARIEDRWPGSGEPGERFADDRHPYANDLDLFGRGSLFELLS